MENTNLYAGWSFDDIIFINRNKAYGAYDLRQRTKKNSGIAMMVVISTLSVLTGLSFTNFTLHKPKQPDKGEEIEITIVSPPHINIITPPPPKITVPPVSTPAVRLLEMVARDDKDVADNDKPVRIEDIKDTHIGAEDKKGDDNVAPAVVESVGKSTAPAITQKDPFIIVEEMPEYQGGDEAMKKFLQDNLSYPDMERENDIQGRVVVGFVVNEDGSISDINVKKGISAGLDREAVRVVKLMPKFKPGRQQGKAVKVYFNLPLKFALQGS